MSNQKDPADSALPAGLEQMREILFGEAQRDTSSEMETMRVALQQLRADQDSALGEVEQSLSSDISKLRTFVDESVADLKEALQDAAAGGSQELKEARKSLESNLKKLDTDITARLDAQDAATKKSFKDTKSTFDKQLKQLSDDAAHRKVVGEYLVEMGQRLANGSGDASGSNGKS